MIKKVLFIFALALSLQLIAGCGCDCSPIKKVYMTSFDPMLRHMDSALPHPMTTSATTIASSNYGIQLLLKTRLGRLKKPNIHWGLIQTAMACDCAYDYVRKDRILSVEILSNNDFDIAHPKNTDLSAYFKAKRGNLMVSLKEYIKIVNELKYTSSNLTDSPFYEGIFLQLAPSLNKKHQFKFKLYLSDGTTLEAETTEVELK